MPLADDRELIQITRQAYQHLKNIVKAQKENGLPMSGTLLASQAILNIPLPQPEIKKVRRVSKTTAPSRAPVIVA